MKAIDMNLILGVLENNTGLCMDDEENRERLATRLVDKITRELEEPDTTGEPMSLPEADVLLRQIVDKALIQESDFAMIRDRLQCLAWHKFHPEKGCACMCSLGHTQDMWAKMQKKGKGT